MKKKGKVFISVVSLLFSGIGAVLGQSVRRFPRHPATDALWNRIQRHTIDYHFSG